MAYGVPSVDAVRPWLQPQERLFGVADVELCGLIRKRVPRRHRPAKAPEAERSGAVDRALGAVLAPLSVVTNVGWMVGDFLSGCLGALLRAVLAPLRGLPFKGGWRSHAGQFVIAVRTGPSSVSGYDNKGTLMAFTDRRLLLVYSGVSNSESLGELPRPYLRRAEIRHWSFSDRVDLHFDDGSLVAVEADEKNAPILQAMIKG